MPQATATEPAKKQEPAVMQESPYDELLLSDLLKGDIITAELLQSIKERSNGDQDLLERMLLNEGYLNELQLGSMKALVGNWKFVDLRQAEHSEETFGLLPRSFIMASHSVPYLHKGKVRVATSNPGNCKMKRLLQKKFGPDTDVLYAIPSALNDIIAKYDTDFACQCERALERHKKAKKSGATDDRSIIDLVDSLLLNGVRHRASDVHIEPRKDESVVRERIDGVLETTLHFEKAVHELIAIRIKVMANLATDEHQKPQDGKIFYRTPDGKDVDVRVSVSPTTDGEKMVLRLLAPQDQVRGMEGLGLQSSDQAILQKEAAKAWGMILVTGPTGSGKTTSLYAIVRKLHKDSVNIATIEDPVEYDLPGVNQMQVNEKAGVTFANGLRSVVRQDPNIILVGEIRDKETAGIAVNAAMTGHLVLSTLHTNDAATAIPRLTDMNIEPFLISSTVNMIVAQRLVRNICVHCRESKDVSAAELKGSLSPEALKKLCGGKRTVRVYEGKGCTVCDGDGYYGRSGIFEILQMNTAIQDLIMKNADADTIKNAAVKAGMHTMLDDGIEKILLGVTSLEEVLRVIRS